ncbi:hypothetical protein [Mycobacteroides abscessus]|uniref:hypothetical protein n=1 Tax=Mycobacteroides abscessus TaxID=36809 RepID=UPI0005DDF1BE|nr:hypothetical protein [Mycobacteroides abscessus]CPR79272.1 Uncharacterised protein [Mycobacteroides abscessus]CPR88422.1 Uncharacterised protein [Mycobacteroides abscessus]CPS43349.1 Uncharacterised protein [Mycobacteroides abscessus]CPV03151.1 Uncharacterised protein [Mycobacteroides abscessus]
MTLHEYEIEVGPYGRTTTLQLSDEDARARGLTPKATKAGKAPANKSAKAPANKGGSPAEPTADAAGAEAPAGTPGDGAEAPADGDSAEA